MERVTSAVSQLFEPATFPNQDGSSDVSISSTEKIDPGADEGLNLQRTLSLIDPAPSKCIREIPNGGVKAWLQVLGSFFLFFNTWYGLINHLIVSKILINCSGE